GGVFTGCAIFYYCDQQGWLPPERCREILGNAFPLLFGTINLFLYDEKPQSIEELQEAYWKAGLLLMSISENSDTELSNKIIELGKNYLATGWRNDELVKVVKEDAKFKEYTAGGPKPLDWDQILAKFVETTQSGINKLTSGDIIGGSIDLAHGLAGISFVTGHAIYACWPEGIWPK
ncbi:MAG: hypothetical protein CVV28_12435, partial [Methanobacteriales archaeon HGW-Methanobacteriales-1]